MNARLPLFILMVLSFSGALAQKEYKSFKTYKGFQWNYTVTQVSKNIYHVQLDEKALPRSEDLGEPVLIRNKGSLPHPFLARANGDSLWIGNKLFMTAIIADSNNRGFRFALQPGEKIFGAGERALPLDRRGYRLNLYNNPWYGYGEGADNLNYSVPFITSSAGYGLFFNNPARGYLDIGKTNPGSLEYGTGSGLLEVYIILGDYREVLFNYHRLTGMQPLPPRWALGNLMSRFGYTSEAQVQNIYEAMVKKGYPVDAVIFDLFWFGDSIKNTMGNLDWVNKNAWPDPAQMIARFKKEGVQTILITEPYFVEKANNYRSARPYLAVDSSGKPYYLTKFYFGNGGLLDIFRKDAQDWFWQFYKKQMNMGVEAWWGDLGEPEHHPADLYHNLADKGYKRLFRSDEVHNLYGHAWTKMLYERYQKEYPAKRLFSLNRAGFAGTQRYGIFPWTGDVSRSWGGLRAQVPLLLGMSMSGVPYVHSDAGGFAGAEGDKELYVRWMQLATFTPIFRPHGTALFEREPAAPSFPSEAALIDAPFGDWAGNAIRQRYEMLPYNYTLAYKQATKGEPLMAPLYYYFPNDTTASSVNDQFFWGESMLVAPVLEKGQTLKKIYLPEGNWVHFYTNKLYSGRQWITDSLDPNYIPVFVKSGSILPMWYNESNPRRNTSGYREGRWMIHYYPSEKPTSDILFEDDGETKYSISNGQYGVLQCKAVTKGKKITMTITTETKKWFAGQRQIDIVIHGNWPFFPRVLINKKRASTFGVIDDGKKVSRFVTIPFSGKPVVLEFELG